MGKLDITNISPTERLAKAPSETTCFDKRTAVEKGNSEKRMKRTATMVAVLGRARPPSRGEKGMKRKKDEKG